MVPHIGQEQVTKGTWVIPDARASVSAALKNISPGRNSTTNSGEG